MVLNFNTATTLTLALARYKLDEHYKLNIEPNHTTLAGHDYEHDLLFASKVREEA